MEETKKSVRKHNVTMDERNLVRMNGIIDVLSFDEEVIICESNIGVIILKGEDLHVNKLDLDNGILEIQGEIVSLVYEDDHAMSKNKMGILSKIFR